MRLLQLMLLTIHVILQVATPLFSLFKVNFHKTPASCKETAQQIFLTACSSPFFPSTCSKLGIVSSTDRIRRQSKEVYKGHYHWTETRGFITSSLWTNALMQVKAYSYKGAANSPARAY